MLPTEKASHIFYNISYNNGKVIDKSLFYDDIRKNKGNYYGVQIKPQHLYGLSDEKPKENDWCYDKFLGLLFQFKTGEANIDYIKKYIKKVIWTTDDSIFPVCDDKCAKHECVCTYPRPSKEFLKKFCELGGIDKVLVEYEIYWNRNTDRNIPTKADLDEVLKVAPDNTVTIYPI
jgi:hypothetical protein